MSLKDKVAIVTGGNSGIGQAIVLELARLHANVVIDYVCHPEATEALEQQVSQLGDQSIGVEADVSKLADLQMLATASALIVAKAVLIANAMPVIRHFDRAPLIRPILFKTAFYWAAVFIVRLVERWIEYLLSRDYVLGGFLKNQISAFSWGHFIAVQLWILVLFLIYVTASEFNHLFGEGELWHLLLTSRPDELPLNRRQRILELVRLSKLADAHSVDEFRDPNSAAHAELVGIVSRLAVQPQPHPS